MRDNDLDEKDLERAVSGLFRIDDRAIQQLQELLAPLESLYQAITGAILEIKSLDKAVYDTLSVSHLVNTFDSPSLTFLRQRTYCSV